MNDNKAIEVAQIKEISSTDIQRVSDRLEVIKEFVTKNLKPEVDYMSLPGKSEKFLKKAGAEKIMLLFQLGVVLKPLDRIIEREENFIMFSYVAKIFHKGTGNVLANFEGTCTNEEKKYREKNVYQDGQVVARERVHCADVLHIVKAMAQKRAMVGAVIIAAGASDYLTQDDDLVENLEPTNQSPTSNSGDRFKNNSHEHVVDKYVVDFGKYNGKKLNEIPKDQITSYMEMLKANGTPSGRAKKFIDTAREFLR